MSLSEGKRMTEYQKIRKQYGTTTYNRIVTPNRLDEYLLYLRDEMEIRELEKEKKSKPKKEKKIQITKKKDSLFDILSEKDKSDKDKPDKDKSDKPDKDKPKGTVNGKKILKITSSLEPDKKKNPLQL